MGRTLLCCMSMLILMSGCDLISPFVNDDLKRSVCDRDNDGLLRDSDYCGGNDCDDGDGNIGEASGWYLDVDRDNFGAGEIEYHCTQPEGYVAISGDCDDTEETIFPESVEICDDIDQDCDELIDEDVIPTWYRDADGDEYGDSAVTLTQCDQPIGFVDNDQDCDDEATGVHPGAEEICDDDIDQDCNDLIDDALTAVLWYLDEDGDGFGNPEGGIYSCEESIDGRVTNALDCDDTDMDVHPDASEACQDKIDNDCDGEIDTDAVDVEWYRDSDGDEYGDPHNTTTDCSPPDGYVGNAGDCDDSDEQTHPEAEEIGNDVIDNT